MYLRFTRRRKDGKEHRYWSIVESRRCAGGRVVQRPVLYLGDINDSQREACCRVVDAFDEGSQQHRQLALFPAGQGIPEHARGYGLQVRLDAMELSRPRQWGACWLSCHLYEQLELDRFWAERLPTRAREPAGGISCRVCVLPADRSRQRMAIASTMVRTERDGGSSRRGLFAGFEDRAVSLPGQAAAAQGRAVQPPAATLAGLRRPLRGSALRLDQHLFRIGPAG